jgi:5-methylcytosine-specific restriction endonuclease McrA
MAKLDKADRPFSEYIRRRDSDENGYGKCISCGKIVHWKDADAGHFVNRAHMSLRYDEKNVNLQCRHCNRFREGEMLGYSEGLVKKYGPEVLDYLKVKKHNICKLGQFEIDLLAKTYKQKIKELCQTER